MKVTNVTFYKNSNKKAKIVAFATVEFNNEFYVSGFKVCEKDDKYSILFPSVYIERNQTWIKTFGLVDAEKDDYELIEDAIFKAFKKQ